MPDPSTLSVNFDEHLESCRMNCAVFGELRLASLGSRPFFGSTKLDDDDWVWLARCVRYDTAAAVSVESGLAYQSHLTPIQVEKNSTRDYSHCLHIKSSVFYSVSVYLAGTLRCDLTRVSRLFNVPKHLGIPGDSIPP
jgi:hypothetical protein